MTVSAAAVLLALLAVPGLSQNRAADSARAIRETGLDPAECYRVRDLRLVKEDIRLFFTEGYLILGKPVEGRRVSAVFTAEVDSGDGEVLLLPPNKGERMSLARFTESPNLNEHFHSAVLLFTDDTAKELAEMLPADKKSAEMGAILADRYRGAVANLSSSFEVRLAGDVLSVPDASNGLFYAALGGVKLGNFDILFDPRSAEQIVVGQVAFRNDRAYFDTWTAFNARSFRNGSRRQPPPGIKIENVRIDATLTPDLNLRCVTRLSVTPAAAGERVQLFEASRQMRVLRATIDGKPAEVFQRESLRAGLIRGNEDDVFLVIAPEPLEKGRGYEFEFQHEGKVILQAGQGVYYVSARASWYPHRGMQFATYDMTFHYPKGMNLVATGEVVEDRTVGETHLTRRRTSSPVRLAGFNLGEYVQAAATARGGYSIQVYGNRKLEPALDKSKDVVLVPVPPNLTRGRRPNELIVAPLDAAPANPNARLQQLASEISGALEFMNGLFGPAPLKSLVVAPIPGTFGQGFPGLVYLSTLSYLDPKDRPSQLRGEVQRVFYSEILHAHEVAHQWWGNVVTSAGYQDEWVMEALANYSALMYLEKRKGAHSLEAVLEDYKTRLLSKKESGTTLESTGPIIWGLRLQSSMAPTAWRTITYEKGSWIVHMLRRRLGDEKFIAMLGELRRRYEYKTLTTDQFRQVAASFLPASSPDSKLELFFESWVYGTGIPTLKVSQSVKGTLPAFKVTGTVSQGDVDEEFSILVPIEVQFGPRAKPLIQWVRTGGDSAPFTIAVKQRPSKVGLAPGVLAR